MDVSRTRFRTRNGAHALLVIAGLTAAPQALATSIAIEDGAIVLGRTQSARVTIRVDEPPGTERLPLRLSVNVGRLSEPARIGPGTFRATYVPPPTRFPQVALVAVWRETGPDARIDFLRMPLFGVTRIPVSARPGAEVKVKVGFDAFGPVVVDRRGRAEIPIVVAPDVHHCEVSIKEKAGGQVSRQVPVEVPPYNRLTAALVPHAIVADGQGHARLDVLYDLGGLEVPPERIRITPTLGQVVFQRAWGGRYTYRYVPPVGTASTSVAFSMAVLEDPTAEASAKLSLGLPPPARVVVTAPAKTVRAGTGDSAPVGVLVLDEAGMGLPNMTVSGIADGRQLPPPVYRGGGLYEFDWKAPAVYPPGGLVGFQATATHPSGTAVTGSANWQLAATSAPSSVVARVEPSPVPADGRTEARLVLEVRDAARLPVDQAQLIVVASEGTLGKLEGSGGGLYRQSYVAPRSLPDGDVTLRVVDPSGNLERLFPIPVRENPGRLLLGLRGGFSLSPGDASGFRADAEIWVPFRLLDATLGAGLTVGYAAASRVVSDPTGALTSRTDATVVPVTLRLGWEAWAGRRFSVTVGAGLVAAWGRFESALASGTEQAWGLGWSTFTDVGWALGPGAAVLEVSYSAATVESAHYRIDPGGVSVLTGYRVRIL